MGTKNAKNGSEAEPKEVEHDGKVIADQILILLISKADGIMTRHKAVAPHRWTTFGRDPCPRHPKLLFCPA